MNLSILMKNVIDLWSLPTTSSVTLQSIMLPHILSVDAIMSIFEVPNSESKVYLSLH